MGKLLRYWLHFRLMHLCDWIHPDKHHCWSCSYECICCIEQDEQDEQNKKFIYLGKESNPDYFNQLVLKERKERHNKKRKKLENE